MFFRLDQQLRFALNNFLAGNRLDEGCFLISVFHDGDSAENLASRDDLWDHTGQIVERIVRHSAMKLGCSFLVAQPDQDHFDQSTFEPPRDRRVGFNSVAHDHVVRFGGHAIKMDR